MERTVPLPAINASVDLTLRGQLIDRIFVEWRHDARTDSYAAFVIDIKNGGEFVEARVQGYRGGDGTTEWFSVEDRWIGDSEPGSSVDDFVGLAEDLAREAVNGPSAYGQYRIYVDGYASDELNFASKSSALAAPFWDDCPSFLKEVKAPKASGYPRCVEFMDSYLAQSAHKNELVVSLEGGRRIGAKTTLERLRRLVCGGLREYFRGRLERMACKKGDLEHRASRGG